MMVMVLWLCGQFFLRGVVELGDKGNVITFVFGWLIMETLNI